MSQPEFERADQEAMNVANRVEKRAIPQSAAPTERIGVAMTEPRNDGKDEKISKAEQVRQIMWTVIQILSCIFAAGMFIAAMLDPGFVVFLANAGVLVCGMAVAVLVDRMVRQHRSS